MPDDPLFVPRAIIAGSLTFLSARFAARFVTVEKLAATSFHDRLFAAIAHGHE